MVKMRCLDVQEIRTYQSHSALLKVVLAVMAGLEDEADQADREVMGAMAHPEW